MGWANVRRVVDVCVERDPNERYVLGLGRAILRRVQGEGLAPVVGFDGAPETTYGGAYAGQVQPNIIGAANGVGSRSVTRDVAGEDISTAVTAPSSAAARQFAARLARGRVIT